jgi:hypothetical protein
MTEAGFAEGTAMGAAEILAACGGGAFVLASLVLGVRLMWLAGRTGGLPEGVMGFGLFLMGGLGYPFTLLALEGDGLGLGQGTREAMVIAQMACNTFGMSALAWFNLRVFRQGQAWARALVGVVAAGYLGPAALQIAGPGLAAFLAGGEGPWQITRLTALLPTTWGAVESLRYHGLLRRRIGLGLGDPVVADRFRLWGVAMACAALITAVTSALEVAGVAVATSTVGGLLMGSLGLAIAVCLTLAFFPPRAYLARVRSRATT